MPGLSLQVLEFADRLLLTQPHGHDRHDLRLHGEPYARVLANGTAEQNVRSPATYLNRASTATSTCPPIAEPAGRRRSGKWSTAPVSSNGTTIASTGCRRCVPPEVKNKSKRTLIFDWQVPIAVGTRKGAIAGQLFWTPESSKATTAVIVLGVVIVLLGLLFVVFVRRRRSRASQDRWRCRRRRGAGGRDGRGRTAWVRRRGEAW